MLKIYIKMKKGGMYMYEYLNIRKSSSTQPRWRSKVVWLGAASALWVLLDALGITQRIGLTNDTFNTVVSSIATILTLFGVLNNPTDSKHF